MPIHAEEYTHISVDLDRDGTVVLLKGRNTVATAMLKYIPSASRPTR